MDPESDLKVFKQVIIRQFNFFSSIYKSSTVFMPLFTHFFNVLSVFWRHYYSQILREVNKRKILFGLEFFIITCLS